MAVVKNSYIKQTGRERSKAKAHIRYIQHRKGKEGVTLTRTLFGRDGAMERGEAYRMIDEATKGSIFFRIIISPDPKAEDTNWDLPLRAVTEYTVLSVEEQFNKRVEWVAAVHADHTPNRHVHVLAILPGRLSRQEFCALPRLLRTVSTNVCRQHRIERDLIQKQGVLREEAAWEWSY